MMNFHPAHVSATNAQIAAEYRVGLHDREIHRRGVVEEIGSDFERPAEIEAAIADLQEQVARLAAAIGAAGLAVMVFDEVVDRRLCLGIHLKAEWGANHFKELAETGLGRVGDVDLVWNSAEEGVIAKILGFQVRGEDQERV